MGYTSMVVRLLPSWHKILLLLYVLANLKSLPLAWHLRVLYHFLANASRKAIPPKTTSPAIPARSRATTPNIDINGQPEQWNGIVTHPLFQPVSLTTRTTFLETDYNLHKSNSTYFSDMDVSRTKLITRLFMPAWRRANMELEKEGRRGRMFVALGAVHTSFKKEIGIYEKVEVRSRVCTWDAKWVVVVSYFIRRNGRKGQTAAQDTELEKKAEEELCAVGLSKYVFKKGRYTIRPEQMLQSAGWLPSKPFKSEDGASRHNGWVEHVAEDEDAGLVGTSSSVNQPSVPAGSRSKGEERELDLVQSSSIAEGMLLDEQAIVAAATSGDDDAGSLPKSSRDTKATVWNAEAWSWDEIEEERQRGLQLAESWLALDSELYSDFEKHRKDQPGVDRSFRQAIARSVSGIDRGSPNVVKFVY